MNMKVSELAKEYKVTSQVILEKLKSLKLKAKDEHQDLSSAVVSVLRSELKLLPVAVKPKAVPPVDPSRRPRWDQVEVRKKVTAKEEPPIEAEPKKLVGAKADGKKSPIKPAVKASVKPKAGEADLKEIPKPSAPKKLAEPPAVIPAKPAAQKTEKPPLPTKPEAPLAPAKDVKPPTPPPAPAAQKPTIQFSDEPFVSVKPLAKRKKIIPGRDSGRDRDFHKPRFSTDGKDTAAKTALREPGALEIPGKLPGDGLALPTTFQDLEVKLPISVKDLAFRLQQKPSVVLKQLLQMGLMANINQNIDEGVVQKLARDFGFNLVKVKTQEEQLVEQHDVEKDDPSKLRPRPPVITFMGHVDHGKTSLMDRIRQSRVADEEHGGITQHIGAYSVKLPKGSITLLDTPGHEAFTSMRARGAHITDLVVLVVAADEGIMPQTEEAIDHARAAKVPLVVALNKIDKKTANADRVKKQLQEHDLTPEEWGGKTICVGVSAQTGEGVNQLLEMILLEAELLELKANAEKPASGIVVEAHLSQGKGALATLIVQNGMLKEGDILVVGPYYCRVKAMYDDHERPITQAGPSTPVEILGLPSVPDAGELFYVMEDERTARDIAYRRRDQRKEQRMSLTSKITLEDLYSKVQQGTIKELNVVIKADVQGSLEALIDSLKKIPSDQVQLNVIHSGVGDINASDCILACASSAIIIGFHVEVDPRAKEELERNPVDVRTYRIIYDAVNDIKNALEGLLEPKTRKKFLARVEVRQVFKLSKSGTIAGCFVQKGKVARKANADLIRNEEVVFSGTIGSLKRFKDDVREVAEGMECGIGLSGFTDYQAGDTIEAYELEKIARKL